MIIRLDNYTNYDIMPFCESRLYCRSGTSLLSLGLHFWAAVHFLEGVEMKIKKITEQSRRDFRAIYECEHCGQEAEGRGYDDSYFHSEVIPKMKCVKCGKMAAEDYRPLTTKYPDGMQV